MQSSGSNKRNHLLIQMNRAVGPQPPLKANYVQLLPPTPVCLDNDRAVTHQYKKPLLCLYCSSLHGRNMVVPRSDLCVNEIAAEIYLTHVTYRYSW